MAEWERADGVDWLVAPRTDGGRAEFGIVLPRGYAQETPSELGIGWAAATALARELRRPRETPDFRVVEVEVAVQVNLQDTVLLLGGDPAAVRLGAAALSQTLHDPSALEPAEPAVPARFPWHGWTAELTAWFGMGTPALAADYDAPWAGEPAALRDAVRRLRPSPTCRAAAWTTEPELVGATFTAADETPDEASDESPGPRLTWREPAPTADGPVAIRATFDNNLLSLRVPATPAGRIAVRLLVQTVHRNLVEFSRVAAGVDATLEHVGTDLLVGVRATAGEQGYDAAAAGTALTQALEAYAGFPDAVLAEELARAQDPDASSWALNALTRTLRAVRSDERPTAAELVAEAASLTPGDLRTAIVATVASTLLGVPRSTEPPADRPLWTPPAAAPIEQPTVTRRSLFPVPIGPTATKQVVRATASTLMVTSRTSVRRGQDKPAPTTTAIDLTAVAVRADSGPSWTTLIDREDRRVTLAWPAYRNPAPLRALVDAATPPPTRISIPANENSTKALLLLQKKFRIGVVVQTVVVLGILAALIWHPVTGRRYQDPVVTSVPAGQLVTLGNGSTVTVSAGRWDESLDQGRQVVSAEVRYCGGGPTVDRNTAEDARNYVTPDRFEVTGIAPASRRVVELQPGEISLEATQLADGQCADGRVAFQVDSASPVSGVQLRYHNGSGDQITWAVS